MPVRDVMIRLGLNSAPFIAGIKSAQAASVGLGSTLTKTAAGGSKSASVLGSSFGTVGIAVGLVGATMVKAAADFDQGMSNVKATGSDAVKNIGALRQAALDAGAATKYSATEATGGVEALAKAGVTSADILKGGLTGALDLAAAGNLDVAGSAEAAASAMNQFGLKGKDVPHIADLLAAAAGKAQGEVSDMAMALNQSGLVANTFGYTIEETTGVLAEFAASGLTGSDAGTALKTMLIRLAAPTDVAATALKKYGIVTRDANGDLKNASAIAGELQSAFKGVDAAERDAALATIFGQDAIRGASILYQDGAAKAAEWTKAVDDAGFAAETAATKMDNLKGDLETFKGSLETLFIEGGGGSQGPLREMTQGATDLTNALLKAKEGLDGLGIKPLSTSGHPAGVFGDLWNRGLAGRFSAETGVERKVITKFQTIGAEGSIAKVMQVARAANLTPKEVRTVLRLLGWSPTRIRAVESALRAADRRARIKAQLSLAGFSPKQINAVATALAGAKSKSQIKAKLTLAGFSPKQIQAILKLLGDVGKAKPKPKAEVNDKATPQLKGIQAMLAGLQDKEINVTTNYRTTGVKPAGGGALEGGTLHSFANGGHLRARARGSISGPGGPTDDLIPAMLSNGEHVLTASDVRMAGGQDAVFRLRAGLQSGAYQFANGGPARSWSSASGGSASPAGASRLISGSLRIDPTTMTALIEGIAQDVVDGNANHRAARERAGGR